MTTAFVRKGLVISATLIALVAGCTKKQEAAPAAAAPGAAPAVKKQMNLAIWTNYITPELLQQFETQTGIHVEVSNYSSNEELLAKLQTGASGYDVVVPSDYMIVAMTNLGLLKPLDMAQLPNSKNLDPDLLKKNFDPENKYTVPYSWGTTGIAVHKDLYKGTIKSWKQLFTSPELKGKFTLLDDSREVIAAALKSLGFSLNSKDPAQLAKVKELLIKARKNVKAFKSETKDALIQKEAGIMHAWSTDALQAREATQGKVEYILPEEGATLWIDNLGIPATAKNVAEAHAFINFMLDPKTNLSTVNTIWVAPANKETYNLLSPTTRGNVSMFPTKEVRAKLEQFEDLGPALESWDRIWTEVKVGSE